MLKKKKKKYFKVVGEKKYERLPGNVFEASVVSSSGG